MSIALRQAQKGIDATVSHWPELRKGMKQTAVLLSASGDQLDRVLKNRTDYEKALAESTELAETFARTAPLFTAQITTQMAEQELALADLEKSLDEVGNTMPAYKSSATDVIGSGRVLAWLAAAIAALHGMVLLTENAEEGRTEIVFRRQRGRIIPTTGGEKWKRTNISARVAGRCIGNISSTVPAFAPKRSTER